MFKILKIFKKSLYLTILFLKDTKIHKNIIIKILSTLILLPIPFFIFYFFSKIILKITGKDVLNTIELLLAIAIWLISLSVVSIFLTFLFNCLNEDEDD